jgi:FkbM family methyltransferase
VTDEGCDVNPITDWFGEPHLCEDYPQAELDHDFSQSGEQAIILEAVKELPVGRFLDIGAGDGRTFSNTVALAGRGWAGVCVEPAAWAFSKLAELYLNVDRIQCCQALVTGEQSGLMTFLYSKDDHLSTVEPSEAAKWASRVPFQRLIAAAVSVGHLLDWFEGRFSVVSIDTEGRTNEIVKAYARHPAWESVEVICFEREQWRRAGALTLTGDFELIADTPNNRLYRRVR